MYKHKRKYIVVSPVTYMAVMLFYWKKKKMCDF